MSTLPPPEPGGFCELVWKQTEPLQQAILDHPFIRELADGTLSRDRFAFYMVQDQRYLTGFSQTLAVASAKAPDPEDAIFLAGSAQTALTVERGMHAEYLAQFGLAESDIAGIRTSLSAQAYVSYLHSVALTEPFPVLVAGALPCFWIYQYVGEDIIGRVADLADHPYRQWISTYADEAFSESVQKARDIVDRAAAAADPQTVADMNSAFVQACEYEWLFWDSAWRTEIWPTAAFLTS
ncbi:MAG TPA: thiaminase II [Mycobacteriales bacterium]|nr:thiaminase II [Mycobacteriales bacterium]